MSLSILTDSIHKIAYSTDAGVYREIPYGVTYPQSADDIRLLLEDAKRRSTSLIPRAGGTSIAGQVVGKGIVVDVSRHLNHILEINKEEKFAIVEPGVVRDELNIACREYGLFFSPETSTSNRCCIGGMVGNNSCGTHSLVYGSTRHHILEAEGVLADGTTELFKTYSIAQLEERFGNKFWENERHSSLIENIYAQLLSFAFNPAIAQLIADNYPSPELKRRSCGYAIDETIADLTDKRKPVAERTINLCRLIAGSEGTLVFLTKIKVSLDPLPAPYVLAVCAHCPTLDTSFQANLTALRHQPTAIELIDSQILGLSLQHSNQLPEFIKGMPQALLVSELRDNDPERLQERAQALVNDLCTTHSIGFCSILRGEEEVGRVWKLRKDGLGILGSMKGDARPTGVIEDTAVAPAELPAYMKDFRLMLDRLGTSCVFYGHISTGELHLRPILNLKTAEGRRLFRQIAEQTTLLVRKHHGTISGEHGDGRLRGEFIPLLYGEEVYQLMRQVKQCWDINGLFNPNKIIDTPRMDYALRYDERQTYAVENELDADQTFYNWKASFDECHTRGATGAKSNVYAMMCSIEQCNGTADCRKSNLIGGTMCPAFKVSGDETKVTRARANVLREILTRGYQSEAFEQNETHNTKGKSIFLSSELSEVLNSCLACKACGKECPSDVNITRLRAEILQHIYDTEGMPLKTWLVSHLATIENLGSLVPHLYNFFATNHLTATLLKNIAGFSVHRQIPVISTRSLSRLIKQISQKNEAGRLRTVWLYADEFSSHEDANVFINFYQLLIRLGYNAKIAPLGESGRAAMSKGNLRFAKRIAAKNIKKIADFVSEETPLVGIEPSCILSFRDEYPDLVSPDMRHTAQQLAKHCLLYDEFLIGEIKAGRINAGNFTTIQADIYLHGHCHQKALVGIEKTAELLNLPQGTEVHVIPSGCCGMAGSFGYEKEHYSTSMAIGEMILFPAVRKAMETGRIKEKATFVAAPGTSCRQQILDGTGIVALHPVEILLKLLK